MDEPLKTWYCDVCQGKIEDVKRGYVIWKSTGSGYRSFKIIHQGKCDLNSHPASAALEDFIGSRGLTYLLSFLTQGPLLTRSRSGTPSIEDFDEFTDLVRRVQTPYYEEARRLFGTEEVEDRFSDANEYLPYLPEMLKSIIEEHEK